MCVPDGRLAVRQGGPPGDTVREGQSFEPAAAPPPLTTTAGNAPVEPSGDAHKNPARVSTELMALFPTGTVAADLREDAPLNLLHPAELAAVQGCEQKRTKDFCAGRLCARKALESFHIHGFPILTAPDRQPIWPRRLIGSITHT